MSRFRVSISGLMLAVLLVGVVIVTLRPFYRAGYEVMIFSHQPGGQMRYLDVMFYLLNLLPMASLLVFLGWETIQKLRKSGRCSAFALGFQNFGWLALLLYGSVIICCRKQLDAGMEFLLGWTMGPVIGPWLGSLPDPLELALIVVLEIFVSALPVLLFATVGGWLAQRGGKSLVMTQPKSDHLEKTARLDVSCPSAPS